MKKTFFKSILCASLFVGALTSCNEVEDLYNPELARERAQEAFGLPVDPNHDWNMVSVVSADITLFEDAFSNYSFRIYTANPLDKESGATILADYPVTTDAQGKASASFKFEMPSYLNYVYVARVDNHGRRWVGVSNVKNGTINKTFGSSSSASTKATTDNEHPAIETPYSEETVNSLSAYTMTDDDLNKSLLEIMKANGKTIKLIGKTYNQRNGFSLFYDNGGMVQYPEVVKEGTFKFIIGEGATWEIPDPSDINANTQISGIDIIVASGGTLKFSSNIQPTIGARIYVLNGGRIESESANAFIDANNQTVLIHNAGTISTNIISLSGGAQIYNADTGVIEVTTIKTTGGGQQIGWDQTANMPILAEEKIINKGRIQAVEIISNGMQGILYNSCLIRAEKISVKQLNLASNSTIEGVQTIECNEYYLRENCIVRATTLRTINGSLFVEYVGIDGGNALISVNTMDLSGNTLYINDKVFIEAPAIIMNGGTVENNNDWIKEQLANTDMEIFLIGGAPITILPPNKTTDIAQADCVGNGNEPTQKEEETSNANIYTYAFEDTDKGAGDYDFNDVVIKCSAPINNKITVTLVAVGAQKRINLMYNNPLTGQTENLFGEVHAAFPNGATENFINTLVGNPTFECPSVEIEVPEGFTYRNNGDFFINVVNSSTTSHLPQFTDNYEDLGVPYAILVPVEWRYPQEWQRVDTAYANFANWAENALVDTNWYTTEINESKVY